MLNIQNKKIGIWGLGIVGTSVLHHVSQHTQHIQILDKKPHDYLSIILQTPQSIIEFLEYNDVIIPSPGINLLNHQAYAHKFLHELDIFNFHNTVSTIAITGTLGKTTITSFIQQSIRNSIAAGNIGFAMLNTLSLPEKPKTIVLELSSYQLQYTQAFAPDFAILTNLYPNHLDHHATMQEYLLAKSMIFKNQKSHQKSLIPYTLIDQIEEQIGTLSSSVFLFSLTKPIIFYKNYPVFYFNKNKLCLWKNNQEIIIFDHIATLPLTTFTENWLITLATLYLYNINIELNILSSLKAAEHRLEFVMQFNNVAIYNDSKSTVWQATKRAIENFPNKRIALFLGGISKGTDRTHLIEFCKYKNITVFAFGKEAEFLSTACIHHQVPCIKTDDLQTALTQFANISSTFDVLLFSPAGASFDLFKNFEDRGTQFKNLLKTLI